MTKMLLRSIAALGLVVGLFAAFPGNAATPTAAPVAEAARLTYCSTVTGSTSFSTRCIGTLLAEPGIGQQRAVARCINPWLGTNTPRKGQWVGVNQWSIIVCAPNEYPAAPKGWELR